MNFLEQKLERKKELLNSRKNNFKIMFLNEFEDDSFEKNAISELLYMLEIKAEIRELKSAIIFNKIKEV